MQISVSNDQARDFRPVQIESAEQLCQLITSSNWSCSKFKEGHRTLNNFISADFIALDVDEGMTVDEALGFFKDYQHVIVATRNHQKMKNGKICDRFRVVIPFTQTVTDSMEYYGAWDQLKEEFPTIDAQCPDPSRLWYPGQKVLNISWQGKRITPHKRIKEIKTVETKIGLKGRLTQATLEFIFNGVEPGLWNSTLYNAALDLRSQGYDQQEVTTILTIPTRKELGNKGELDDSDHSSIQSAFDADVRHDKRGVEDCFDFESVGTIIKDKRQIDWLVDGLLGPGAISLIAGAPKSGKSTIIRQLCKNIAQGDTQFLGRNVKQGKVFYLALEEQRDIMAQQLRQQGVTDDDPFYIHTGPVFAENKYQALKEMIASHRPALVVVDTLILFAGVKDLNNYTEMYEILSKFRDAARKGNTHILFIHHQNKSEHGGTSSIMGSSAIHGAVDIAMIFTKFKGKRYLTTSQRGGRSFNNQALEFDETTQTYDLGIAEGFGDE